MDKAEIHRLLSKANGHKLPNGEQIPVIGIGTWDVSNSVLIEENIFLVLLNQLS